MNFEPRRTNEESNADDEQQKYATQFYEHGGIEVRNNIKEKDLRIPHIVSIFKVMYTCICSSGSQVFFFLYQTNLYLLQ